MSTQIKGFITRDDFVTPRNQEVSPLYELSELSYTYSYRKQVIYPSDQPTYALHVFHAETTGNTVVPQITQLQSQAIVRVVSEFSNYLTGNPIATKQQAIVNFTNQHNALFPDRPITNLTYNTVKIHNNIRVPDYLTFTILGVDCSIWTNDQMFQTFYPKYDIRTVFPFDNFANIVQNTSQMLDALGQFDPVIFNERIEQDKVGYPPTVTRIMNIPYRVPNTTVERNCYFAFNIYGRHGNYDYILKLELYRVLTEELGLSGSFVEEVFPTILRINEFFLVPRWERLAIPSRVGQIGINSQISKTYSEVYDTRKFIKIYDQDVYIKNNTYDVPATYNNLLVQVTNGYYSEERIRAFTGYYPDIISVSSLSQDFGRMSSRTQRFIILLENLLDIADSNNQTELFNKVVQNDSYLFTIIDRGGVTYVSVFFEEHQYYVIPKFEFLRLL